VRPSLDGSAEERAVAPRFLARCLFSSARRPAGAGRPITVQSRSPYNRPLEEIDLPKPKPKPHLEEYAKLGAEVRLRDVVNELTMLVELFPHLKDNFDRDELPISFILKRDARRAANRTEKEKSARRGTMSPEAREKIRQAQLKRWAKQRSAAKK
jgi:hypothetical protein